MIFFFLGLGRGSSGRGSRVRYRGGGGAGGSGDDPTETILAIAIGGLTGLGMVLVFIVFCCDCPKSCLRCIRGKPLKIPFIMICCMHTEHCMGCREGNSSTESQTQAGTELHDYPQSYSRAEETTIFNVGSTMNSLSNGRSVQTPRGPNEQQTSSSESTNSDSNCDITFDSERGILNFSTFKQSDDPPRYEDIYRK